MNKQCVFLLASLLTTVSVKAQINIDVDPSQKGVSVSNMLNGIFFEDINHAADGGLYAELIRNRSFEDNDSVAENWHVFETAGASAQVQLIGRKLLNENQHKALEVKFSATHKAFAGIANDGFWGINVVQGRTYKLSFWAKGKLKGHLKMALMDQFGITTYAETVIDDKITNKWKKYSATFTANATDGQAKFFILSDGKGIVDFDVVSLFPPTFMGRDNGCRPDLAQLLYDMHPKFMRFPGGCFVEGQEKPENAFHWERTIGPIEKRPGHLNRNWGYRTTDGMGFHEFLQLAEDIKAKPLYVINIGLWHGGMTPLDSIQPWIDECMNALEYANGDITTKYGKMRADNGHPAPFNIEYLEIGNENNQPEQDMKSQSDHYYNRFKKFKDAVLTKYPHMHLIGNVAAWGTDDPKWNSGEEVELLDEHYYRNPAWFTDNYHKYDFYPRSGSKIYCGEYAVTQGFGKIGSLNAALGEAVYMMGMENNSDVVSMNSYAPIFVNENNVAWQPDMIRFKSNKAICTPSYYVQKLMAKNIGDRMISVSQSNPYKNVPIVQNKLKACQVGVGTWATNSSFDNIKVESAETQVSDDCYNSSNFKTIQGDWTSEDGVLTQKSSKESCLEVLDRQISGSKYTYTLRARKNCGKEGFLIVFNYQDSQNYCWLNIGGWGNTLNGLEQIVDGGKGQIASCPGNIEAGKWYDIKINVDGDSVKCYLNKELIISSKLLNNITPGIFSNASIIEKSGDIFIKIVNTESISTTAKLNIKNFDWKDADIIRLTSANGTDENTFENPTKVYPIMEKLMPTGSFVSVDIPAYSLNIVRLRK